MWLLLVAGWALSRGREKSKCSSKARLFEFSVANLSHKRKQVEEDHNVCMGEWFIQ
jgi:hypothetical protein